SSMIFRLHLESVGLIRSMIFRLRFSLLSMIRIFISVSLEQVPLDTTTLLRAVNLWYNEIYPLTTRVMTPMTIVLIVLAVVAVWAIWAYNRFVTLTQRAKEAWADIDVQLKRRYDLIPNLIETVKGYAAHERGTLDEVTQARAQATQVH